MRFLVCILLAVAGPALADLCSKCSCPRNPTEVIFVNCTCASSDMDLVLAREDLSKRSTMKKMIVSSCRNLVFKRDSFADIHDLDTLHIQDVKDVDFPTGVFSSLGALIIENVKNLQFQTNAFRGVDVLKNIVIKHSSLNELQGHALNDMKGLHSIVLDNVTVNVMRENALRLQMDRGSSFKLHNSKIKSIETNGMVVFAMQEFLIENCTLDNVTHGGINISSEGFVGLTGNTIRDTVSQSGITINARLINVTNNLFHNLSGEFLSQVTTKLGPVFFVNNTFLQADLQPSDINKFTEGTFAENHLSCLCSQARAYDSLSVKHFLVRNLCIAPCRLPLQDFPHQCTKTSGPDDVNGASLCIGVTTTTTTTTQRPGRALSFPTTGTNVRETTESHHEHLNTPAPREINSASGLVSSLTLVMAAALQQNIHCL